MTTENAAEDDRPEADSQASLSPKKASRTRLTRAVLKCRWLILYAITVSAMIWWYEFRPVSNASQQLRGNWREIEGIIPDEQPGDLYLHIDQDELWSLFPPGHRWQARKSRISVQPADQFFVIKREFDYANTLEDEYIVCLKNDELYIIRGLAQFDRVLEHSIQKLNRVDSLPQGSMESIQTYRDRNSSAR